MIIAENDKNNRTVIEFDTVRVNSKMGGESNRHWLKARPSGMKSDKTVFQEAVEACSLNVKPKAAAYLFDAVLSTAVAKVAEDGVPRRIGDLIKVYPVIKGTVEGPYSPYSPETCACLVAPSACSAAWRKPSRPRTSGSSIGDPVSPRRLRNSCP